MEKKTLWLNFTNWWNLISKLVEAIFSLWLKYILHLAVCYIYNEPATGMGTGCLQSCAGWQLGFTKLWLFQMLVRKHTCVAVCFLCFFVLFLNALIFMLCLLTQVFDWRDKPHSWHPVTNEELGNGQNFHVVSPVWSLVEDSFELHKCLHCWC